ncbi:MAG: hypothetical protein P8K08_09535 [Fuerstiella sp.]|nr:hypothetical protein [Fuerstiella sp.]
MNTQLVGRAGKHFVVAMLGLRGGIASEIHSEGRKLDVVAEPDVKICVKTNQMKPGAAFCEFDFDEWDFLAVVHTVEEADELNIQQTWLIPRSVVQDQAKKNPSGKGMPDAYLNLSQLQSDMYRYIENWRLNDTESVNP